MNTADFAASIRPFFWTDHETSASVRLYAGSYKNEVFQSREDEGCEGNGYDWESLARVFLAEKAPELSDALGFDSEGSMFCAYSTDKDALKNFILKFKAACEDDALIMDIFSRAELYD